VSCLGRESNHDSLVIQPIAYSLYWHRDPGSRKSRLYFSAVLISYRISLMYVHAHVFRSILSHSFVCATCVARYKEEAVLQFAHNALSGNKYSDFKNYGRNEFRCVDGAEHWNCCLVGHDSVNWWVVTNVLGCHAASFYNEVDSSEPRQATIK
jgi:hypothetical protein